MAEQPIRLARPDVGDEEAGAVAEVLESGYLTMGPKVAEFESALAAACDVRHVVAVSSGTAALHLAMVALEIGPGDEVIVPAYTFPATANVVALAGGPAPPRGRRSSDDEPRPRARRRGCDAAHEGRRRRASLRAPAGLGRPAQRRPRGNRADELADAIRRMRHQGIEPRGEFEIRVPGLNYRLADILCAVGTPQVKRLDQLHAARARVAVAYAARLAGVVDLPAADDGDVHGWQAFVVQVEGRDDALRALRERGIEAQIGTYALHHLAAYRDQSAFPGADAAYRRAPALPFHTRLTESELDRVAEALRAVA